MSMMTVHCAWCGEDYIFGVVGKEMIGGHHCEGVKPCAHEGCEEKGNVQITDDYELKFVCWHHLPDDAVILGVQPMTSDELKEQHEP